MSPIATDVKDGSACEYLQSLEIIVTALHWIMLLQSVVTLVIMNECEGNCLEWWDAVQSGIHVYVAASTCYAFSNKNFTAPHASRQ